MDIENGKKKSALQCHDDKKEREKKKIEMTFRDGRRNFFILLLNGPSKKCPNIYTHTQHRVYT